MVNVCHVMLSGSSFWLLFVSLIGRIARYAPSSRNEKHLKKYKSQIMPNYFFTVAKITSVANDRNIYG